MQIPFASKLPSCSHDSVPVHVVEIAQMSKSVLGTMCTAPVTHEMRACVSCRPMLPARRRPPNERAAQSDNQYVSYAHVLLWSAMNAAVECRAHEFLIRSLLDCRHAYLAGEYTWQRIGIFNNWRVATLNLNELFSTANADTYTLRLFCESIETMNSIISSSPCSSSILLSASAFLSSGNEFVVHHPNGFSFFLHIPWLQSPCLILIITRTECIMRHDFVAMMRIGRVLDFY